MSGTIIKIGKVITKTAEKIMLNATNGDINFNAAKSVVVSSDKEITYSSYEAVTPDAQEDLLVKKVKGPKEVTVGKEYIFTAAVFSRKATPIELQSVKWAYKIDDGAIQYFKNPGTVIGGVVTKKIYIDEELWDNKTLKVYAYFQNPSDDNSVTCDIKLGLIDVTTNKGKYLFSLKPNEKNKSQTIKAKDLYKKGIQWFCPYVDNYIELIKKNEKLSVFEELKHFSWKQIVDFSEIERWNISYRSSGSGDWKASEEGADGYLLVTINGFPYWADAIGQIPFTVDIYTDNLEDGYSKENSIKETLLVGQKYGDGNIIGGESDFSNGYDNHIILRASLWASNRYDVKVTTRMMKFSTRKTYKAIRKGYPENNLGIFLKEQDVKKYFK
ncbi:hypothetical protein J2Q11_13045 [Tenacibaculum finnmarkense genomovar finnmarkense]|uniref:hypothetical protein n=1 Tax=Tenacibaculum finnmarkense TaxID=2781243 RepID=UPI001E3ADDC9|nr:hypothetical protein [Tenacibaculum finnmarkense]MCD8418576.1 hypothetical protein [Tenacibaculum finnmarkense genomovar finnmarkense]MCG8186934.1 hypothetical protein [Tenacibaculum finnmarkense genomovar finnmarkense]MCG8203416.1 hypothetical protein [Tenacibaculum finnmarkense genomovar finnmarkense]MCG8210987.1 hypothetical protein [Tenacibaculum finnmarkense genomovar finnmarkense]MCG8213742.1 hypothetical protein [Tenacibaculum finnmarkense genomovar finnmarkense]